MHLLAYFAYTACLHTLTWWNIPDLYTILKGLADFQKLQGFTQLTAGLGEDPQKQAIFDDFGSIQANHPAARDLTKFRMQGDSTTQANHPAAGG